MKPMEFCNYEKDHLSDKTFSNIEHPQTSNILISGIFVAYYNKWHQSINWTSIEILIKTNLEKALKLNSLAPVLKNWSF